MAASVCKGEKVCVSNTYVFPRKTRGNSTFRCVSLGKQRETVLLWFTRSVSYRESRGGKSQKYRFPLFSFGNATKSTVSLCFSVWKCHFESLRLRNLHLPCPDCWNYSGFNCVFGTREFRIRKALEMGTRASQQLSSVLANIGDFVESIEKPLDREQFWASANVALKDGKLEGRKVPLVLDNIDDFAKTMKNSWDQAHFLIVEGEWLQGRFGE